MSSPIPLKQDVPKELRLVATTLSDDAQNAALRKCKELDFDTNKGMISLEETLINLSAARDILLDAVDKGKLSQLPLKLQYSLYDQTQRAAKELAALVNDSLEPFVGRKRYCGSILSIRADSRIARQRTAQALPNPYK